MYGMALQLLSCFYQLREKPLGCYFKVWSRAQCNQKVHFYIFMVTDHFEEKKGKYQHYLQLPIPFITLSQFF